MPLVPDLGSFYVQIFQNVESMCEVRFGSIIKNAPVQKPNFNGNFINYLFFIKTKPKKSNTSAQCFDECFFFFGVGTNLKQFLFEIKRFC